MAEEAKRKANPAALGLIGFGFTTVLWSLVDPGVLPIAGMSAIVTSETFGKAVLPLVLFRE